MREGPGDRLARFRVLYDAAYPRITAYALRRARSPEDALDVVAETMLVAWRRFDEIPEGPARLPWMFGVARRALANHYRAERRKEGLRQRAAAERNGPAPEFDLVHQALDRVPLDQREILTLSAWDDLDNHEIAAALGTTPAAIAVRLHRARRRLARELGRLGLTAAGESLQSEAGERTPGRVQENPPGSGKEVRP
jgi:RNA polymerase sigma-70 factor (ECF subfamily)